MAVDDLAQKPMHKLPTRCLISVLSSRGSVRPILGRLYPFSALYVGWTGVAGCFTL